MSLAVTYETLQCSIGRFLGYDRDPGNWSEDEQADVEEVIAKGLRQFYRPPRLPSERESHQWSFMRPLGTLEITTGTGDYEMPSDFADLDGDLYYVTTELSPHRIRTVHEGRILELRQRNHYAQTTTYPREAAIVPVKGDGSEELVYQLMIWPLPDADYTLKFRYFARQQMLTDAADIPLGGSEHAETILASCLAAAESFLDDERGNKYQEFMDQLAASVDFDRRANTPSTLGYMCDRSDRRGIEPYVRSPNITTYEKYPL